MQGNKKTIVSKKNLVKKKIQKISNHEADTIYTTKQKTFATIEETYEFHDHKTSTRTTHYTSRRDCLDKMQANKLSPFSSPGRSLTPKSKKSLSPIVKQKQTKKTKKACIVQQPNPNKKQSIPSSKVNKNTKAVKKPKIKVEEKEKVKKITEVSYELEDSIPKLSKLIAAAKKQSFIKAPKSKNGLIREMHDKIKEKYRKQYPKLHHQEMKVLAAVILIQRLWRQTKVKLMINQFLSPRSSSTNANFQLAFQKSHRQASFISPRSYSQGSSRSLNQTGQYKQGHVKSEETIRQQQKSSLEEISSIDKSNLFLTPEKLDIEHPSINLRSLELSDQLSGTGSSTKAKEILRYIDMYREVKLKSMKQKKKKKPSKPNAFNFPQSLSEKCLLQNLYKKRVNIKNTQKKEGQKIASLDFFLPSKSTERFKQLYTSPKKPQVVVLEERFYTEGQDTEQPIIIKQEKQPLKLEQQTIGSIGNVSNSIVFELINQFCEQFQAFTKTECLKKKKKKKSMPGIKINSQTIQQYLKQLTKYIRSQHKNHLQDSFTQINANKFLKFLRIPLDEQLFPPASEENDEQQELNNLAIPKTAFFEYQPIYQKSIFKINEEDKNCFNFLGGLIKIHNKCLIDIYSQYIQKQRFQRIQFPWDKIGPIKSEQQIRQQVNRNITERLSTIIRQIIDVSNTRLGRLHKKDSQVQQINLLKSLKQDYKREGKDWAEHQDFLEIRLELAQLITQDLIDEITLEMSDNSQK